MKLSALNKQFQSAELVGEDQEITGLVPPGRGDEQTAELWREGTVNCSGPAIVDGELEVESAPVHLRVEELNDKLPELLAEFESSPTFSGISENAEIADDFEFQAPIHIGPGTVIGPGVSCGKEVRIEPNVTISGQVRLDSGVHLHSGVQIQSPAQLGENVEIHSNTVVGADGYGYQQREGQHVKIPQIGGVKIGANVEIGAVTTIDRGTVGKTTIGRGTKIDDQVHIAHNCEIGACCLLVGRAALAGTVKLGEQVTIAGQSIVKDHVRIADRVTVAGRSGVTKDIEEEDVVVSGYPARPHRKELRQKAMLRKLPEMYKKLKQLE